MASNNSKLFVKSSTGSSAIRIVNPNTQDEVSRPQSRKDTVNRKCKNMILYGSCRLQGKGCNYDHDTADDTDIQDTSGLEQSLSNISLRDPASPTPSQAAVNVNAPVFVPKTSPVISYAKPATTEPQTAAAAAVL
jgi:PAB-dependent poly(A)-specific ribonuclease subunit 3